MQTHYARYFYLLDLFYTSQSITWIFALTGKRQRGKGRKIETECITSNQNISLFCQTSESFKYFLFPRFFLLFHSRHSLLSSFACDECWRTEEMRRKGKLRTKCCLKGFTVMREHISKHCSQPRRRGEKWRSEFILICVRNNTNSPVFIQRAPALSIRCMKSNTIFRQIFWEEYSKLFC